jgi:hypothetical protein
MHDGLPDACVLGAETDPERRKRCRGYIYSRVACAKLVATLTLCFAATSATNVNTMPGSLFEPQLFADDDGKLLPLALDDELFILERAKISFQVKDPAYVHPSFLRRMCSYLTLAPCVHRQPRDVQEQGEHLLHHTAHHLRGRQAVDAARPRLRRLCTSGAALPFAQVSLSLSLSPRARDRRCRSPR